MQINSINSIMSNNTHFSKSNNKQVHNNYYNYTIAKTPSFQGSHKVNFATTFGILGIVASTIITDGQITMNNLLKAGASSTILGGLIGYKFDSIEKEFENDKKEEEDFKKHWDQY